MGFTVDQLAELLRSGGLRVNIVGATCIHCGTMFDTTAEAEAHDAMCPSHPMSVEVAALRQQLAAAGKKAARADHYESVIQTAEADRDSLAQQLEETKKTLEGWKQNAEANGEGWAEALKALAAIRQALATGGWEPIADKHRVHEKKWLLSTNEGTQVGWWDEGEPDEDGIWVNELDKEIYPTHAKPLPEGPPEVKR